MGTEARRHGGGLRVGVVGVGYWGSQHMRVLRSTTGVAAVTGIDRRYAGEGGGQTPDSDGVGFADLAEALPSVDAVVIATPPSSHAALGLLAIAAGKHVLIEKPLAVRVTEARALMEAAEAAGVVLMSGQTFEHNVAVRKLRELVRGGDLGRIYYLDCARLNLGLYQSDVNVVVALAPYDISVANFVLGSPPTTVTAWGSRPAHPAHEDVAHLRLDYTDLGVRVNIHVSWLEPRPIWRVTVVGSKKVASYDDLNAQERIRVYDKTPVDGEEPLSGLVCRPRDVVSPAIACSESLAAQDQHFVDCILDGTRPAADGGSGLGVVQALECAQISLAEQRPVALAELSRRPGAPVARAFAGAPS